MARYSSAPSPVRAPWLAAERPALIPSAIFVTSADARMRGGGRMMLLPDTWTAELCAWRETNASTDFPAADGKARLLGRLSSKKFDVTGRDVA